jgi:hypothetical protein
MNYTRIREEQLVFTIEGNRGIRVQIGRQKVKEVNFFKVG